MIITKTSRNEGKKTRKYKKQVIIKVLEKEQVYFGGNLAGV